jgi:hypothetical protein
MSQPSSKSTAFTVNLQSPLLTTTADDLYHCNGSAMHVVLTLPNAPPVLGTANTLLESWTADRKAWEAYEEEDWFMRQIFEPLLPHNGRSILIRWLKDVVEGKSWTCCVPLDVEESWCDHGPFTRLDRAVAHVRRHLDLKPFPCGGQCGNEEWYVKKLSWRFHIINHPQCSDQRFHSSETLSTHRRGPDYRSCDLW